MSGEKILIHGAGVGFQTVLLAKQMALHVLETASGNDRTTLDKARLNQFIDYRSQDFSQLIKSGEVDYIFDVLGGKTLQKSILLKPEKWYR